MSGLYGCFLTEGTGSNFFLVKDGTLYSPEPRNILRGISRGYVMALAREMKIPVIEKNLEPYDLLTADEAFFTCTPFCMVPAFKFNGHPIGDGKIGPIYKNLISEWGKRVNVDIIAQIQKWAAVAQDSDATGATPYSFSEKRS